MTTMVSHAPASPDPEEEELDSEIASIRAESKRRKPKPLDPAPEANQMKSESFKNTSASSHPAS